MELVVVVALVGVMAGVVAPSIVSLDRPPAAQSAIDHIDGLVRLGRTTAIERAQRVELTIDPLSARFWFDVPDTSATIALPEGAVLAASTKRVHVQFEPNGAASIDAPLFVRLGEATLGVVVSR